MTKKSVLPHSLTPLSAVMILVMNEKVVPELREEMKTRRREEPP
jgi:hypothetical protein